MRLKSFQTVLAYQGGNWHKSTFLRYTGRGTGLVITDQGDKHTLPLTFIKSSSSAVTK